MFKSFKNSSQSCLTRIFHFLTLRLTYYLTFTLSPSNKQKLNFLNLSLKQTNTLTLSYSHTFNLSTSLFYYLTLILPHSHNISFLHSHTLTLSHSHTLKLSPGYQKALERENSVLRPKGFCEADKVKLSAVLTQNPKCRNLHLIDILIFFLNIGFYWSFGKL